MLALREERPRVAWAWLAGLSAALLHLPSVAGPFLFDDLRQAEAWRTTALLHTLTSAFLHRGLSQASYLLTRAAWGENPLGFHLVNLAVWTLTVAALFLLARALMRPGMPKSFPFLCAAWWAALPVSCESVDYVSGRPGMLAALFAITTAAWAAERARGGLLQRVGVWKILAGTALGSLLAAACKETGWMTPFLVAPSVFLADGRPWRTQARLWMPPAAAGLASGVVLAMFWRQGPTHAGMRERSFFWMGGYWMDQVGVWGVEFLPRWVLPFGRWAPNAEIDLPLTDDPGRQMWGGLVFGGLMLLAWFGRKRLPLAGLALAWMLVSAVPASVTPLADRGAERHGLLASAGAALLAGSLLAGVWARKGLWRAGAVTALAAMALMVPARAGAWGSPAAFWADALRKTPLKERASYNYARSQDEAGRLEAALAFYRRADLTTPGQAKLPSAMALCLARLGRYEEAATAYARATDLELAAIRMGMQPRQHAGLLAVDAHNRIRILLALGRREEARRVCEEVLTLPTVGRYPPLKEDAKELGISP